MNLNIIKSPFPSSRGRETGCMGCVLRSSHSSCVQSATLLSVTLAVAIASWGSLLKGFREHEM